ncbi:hypothetical protein HER21_28675 [Pseudomonas sp. BGM005]|nr:hypothetical protein [Pseudomonas sp. BG5]
MSLQPLPPDALEQRVAAQPDLLKPCPFCGRAAALHSAVSQMVRGLQRQALYQSVVACTDPHCLGQVMQNQRGRAAAQRAAISRWNTRAAPAA